MGKYGTKNVNMGIFIVGVIVCILAVVFGLWMGLYVCFYGGIVNIITGFSADPWTAGVIAWGALKVLCTGFVGWLTFVLGFGAGTFLIALSED